MNISTSMRTIKLVIIGDSGVGKTSLRSNYISGRFSTGYRATIGTDFITKALPHHSNPGEMVTLQIWDTAGQERFSSLSTAFFRGADAVLMMYDVNSPATLQGLRKWWKEFQQRAPVPEEEASDYCCIVVGNKIDLVEDTEGGRRMAVSEENARTFLEELIPTLSTSPATVHPATYDGQQEIEPSSPRRDVPHTPNGNGFVYPVGDEDDTSRPKPIDIRFSGHTVNRPSVSRATSRSRLNGTMTTTRTGLSVYHTPSSSFFDDFVSAPSSPIHSANPSAATSRTQHAGMSPSVSHRKSETFSISSASATIRPYSLTVSPPPTPPLDRGPKLFLASAKSGHAVPNIFEYVARRVVLRWEWEDRVQARTLDFTERGGEIRDLPQLGDDPGRATTCCA